MKVLITTDLYEPTINGVVTSVQNLMSELKKDGHQVKILATSDRHRSYRKDNIYYLRSIPIRVYPNVRMPVAWMHPFVTELIEWKPDVIHSQCEFFSYQFAKRISRRTGAPIVHTYHTLYEQYAKYVVKKFASRLNTDHMIAALSRVRLKKAEVVIAPTGKVRRYLEQYGLENEIQVVPTGISLDQYKKHLTPEEKQKRKAELGIGPEKQVLLSLGRVGTEKNIEELIRFFNTLCRQREDVVFLIVGDGPAREELQQLTDTLGLSEKIRFTGMVPREEVQNYYQLGDLFVCASTSETQGLTYIEALVNFLPLLCRKDPCLEGVIEEGRNGFQYETEEEFLQHAAYILDHPRWREEAAEYNQMVERNFCKECFANSVEKIYQEAIEQKRTAREGDPELLYRIEQYWKELEERLDAAFHPWDKTP